MQLECQKQNLIKMNNNNPNRITVLLVVLSFGIFLCDCQSQNCIVDSEKYHDTYRSMIDRAGDTVFVCDLAIRNYPSDYQLDNIKVIAYKKNGQWIGRQIKYYWDNGYWVVDFCVEKALFSDIYYDIDSLFYEVFSIVSSVPQKIDMEGEGVFTKVYCKSGTSEYEKKLGGNMRNIQRLYPSLFAFFSWAFFESTHDGIERSMRIKEDYGMHN